VTVTVLVVTPSAGTPAGVALTLLVAAGEYSVRTTWPRAPAPPALFEFSAYPADPPPPGADPATPP
jgi:hypothetical protein